MKTIFYFLMFFCATSIFAMDGLPLDLAIVNGNQFNFYFANSSLDQDNFRSRLSEKETRLLSIWERTATLLLRGELGLMKKSKPLQSLISNLKMIKTITEHHA